MLNKKAPKPYDTPEISFKQGRWKRGGGGGLGEGSGASTPPNIILN